MTHPWHKIPYKNKALYHAYIEITPQDTLKYELDKSTGFLMVDRPQMFSNITPFLYGFIPQTYSGELTANHVNKKLKSDYVGDLDPVDVCVLTAHNLKNGVFIKCKVIGGLRMIDGDEVDDKLIAVLDGDIAYENINDIKDLSENQLNKIKHYFETYKGNKKVELRGFFNSAEATKMVELGHLDYRELQFSS
jgi:inorganic pyrophosphatase